MQSKSVVRDNLEIKTYVTLNSKNHVNDNEENKRQISNEIYFELSSMKGKNNESYRKLDNKIADIDVRLNQFESKLEALTISYTELRNLDLRLSQLEYSFQKLCQWKDKFEQLKYQLNSLSVEVSLLHKIKEYEYATLGDILKSHITETFSDLKFSFDINMNNLNKMLSDNFSRNAILIRHLNQNGQIRNLPVLKEPSNNNDENMKCSLADNLQQEPVKYFPVTDANPVKSDNGEGGNLNNQTPYCTSNINLFNNSKISEGSNFPFPRFQCLTQIDDSSLDKPTLQQEQPKPGNGLSNMSHSLFGDSSKLNPSISSPSIDLNQCGNYFPPKQNPFNDDRQMTFSNENHNVSAKAHFSFPSTEISSVVNKPFFGSLSNSNFLSVQKSFQPSFIGKNVSEKNLEEKDVEDVINKADHEDDEEEHDPHFKPIIDLPPLITLTKDEDEHDILFKSRSKLYLFSNGEWKERGVGEMKILRTKPSTTESLQSVVKMVMRRDQVRKICCNQRVTKDAPIFTAMPNVKSVCWIANDFSNDTSSGLEKFAIRFPNVDLLNEFKDVIVNVQMSL